MQCERKLYGLCLKLCFHLNVVKRDKIVKYLPETASFAPSILCFTNMKRFWKFVLCLSHIPESFSIFCPEPFSPLFKQYTLHQTGQRNQDYLIVVYSKTNICNSATKTHNTQYKSNFFNVMIQSLSSMWRESVSIKSKCLWVFLSLLKVSGRRRNYSDQAF